MRKRTINVDAMSKAELGRLYAECETITPDTPSRPLDKTDRALLERAARKGGRQRVGLGAQRINVTVERSLLKRVDAFAHKTGVTRAALVAEGLRKMVSMKDPALLQKLEDESDIKAAAKARKEPGGIPLEQIKARLARR